MGRLMKRAVVTSSMALQEAGMDNVDAIITGTGWGCIQNTELFLGALCREGEQMLKPTWFMQSTHNTLSSLIAIRLKSHAYNATYSHKGVSFDCALHDALTRMSSGQAKTALVSGFDECSPTFHDIIRRGGYVGHEGQVQSGEVAVSMVLSHETANAMCRVCGMEMLYRPDVHDVAEAIERLGGMPGYIVTGRNGWEAYDQAYTQLLPSGVLLLPEPFRYKQQCGESFSASAYGVLAAAQTVAGRTLVINIDGCGQRMSLLVLDKI